MRMGAHICILETLIHIATLLAFEDKEPFIQVTENCQSPDIFTNLTKEYHPSGVYAYKNK